MPLEELEENDMARKKHDSTIDTRKNYGTKKETREKSLPVRLKR